MLLVGHHSHGYPGSTSQGVRSKLASHSGSDHLLRLDSDPVHAVAVDMLDLAQPSELALVLEGSAAC